MIVVGAKHFQHGWHTFRAAEFGKADGREETRPGFLVREQLDETIVGLRGGSVGKGFGRLGANFRITVATRA